MTDPIDLEALRAALAAGPTPGPWTAHVTTREVEVTAPCGRAIYVAGANTDSESIPDAEWIAAANPHVIGALVAELTTRRARDAETHNAMAMALQHIRLCAPDPTVDAALDAALLPFQRSDDKGDAT